MVRELTAPYASKNAHVTVYSSFYLKSINIKMREQKE